MNNSAMEDNREKIKAFDDSDKPIRALFGLTAREIMAACDGCGITGLTPLGDILKRIGSPSSVD